MMHNKQPYSFEKTDVRGLFLLKFSCTNVKSETFCPIAANVSGLCVVALSINLILTTTHSWAITQNTCYVPFLLTTILK